MPVVTPLFRREALDARRVRGPGAVLLTGTPARRWLCLLYTGVLAAALLFLCRASYARTATVGGVVLPADGLLRIVAATGGRVTRVLVSEGQTVSSGQPLLVIGSLRTDNRGANADAQQRQLLALQRLGLQVELQQLRLQQATRLTAAASGIEDQQALLAQLAQSTELQRRHVQLAADTLRRFQQLAEGGHVAAMSVQERETEWLEQQQRLVDLQRAESEAQRQLHNAQSTLAEARLQAAREQSVAGRSLAALDQQLLDAEARESWLVTAPTGGRISAIEVQAGQVAVGGQTLATVVNPTVPLVVELYAPSRAAGLLRAGQSVSLRFQAFPFQQFGQYVGTVQQISGNALQPGELGPEAATLQGRGAEPQYRVRVALASQAVHRGGREFRLQPGTLVEASIRLESRRLYQWLLAPLAGFGARR
jgi:membrane fusion protein